MKHITKFIALAFFVSLSASTFAQDCGGNYYITRNVGWTSSEYYKIIDIDAATLTDAALPKSSAANGSLNAVEADFNSGVFKSPILTTADGITYTPTDVLWPINYYMAAFAPTLYNSAYSKVQNGATPSGGGTTVACTLNDNSIAKSAIWDKPGFIELSRLGSAVLNVGPSRHGYLEIDNLPSVERIQWSYSSTSIKRGVKCDINYNDGTGWKPQRWIASDYSNWEGTFAEQGYQFEEKISKQDDPTSKVSIRFRIWDGDSINFKVNANDLSLQTVPYTATMTPLAQKQTVRIHQIKVYSGVVPTEVPSAVASVMNDIFKIHLSNQNIILSTEANVELFSIDGKKVFNGYTKQVDVSNLNRGIYIIRAIGNDGKIQNKKIVI
jgi:hypothetical protein